MTDLPILIPGRAATLAGFREWALSADFPEHIRAAYLDGQLYLEPNVGELETEVKVKGEVYRSLANLLEGRDVGELYPSGLLISNEEANLATNPDGSFTSWESFITGKVIRVPHPERPRQFPEQTGAPDWVLEVVNETSVVKDTALLVELYHRAGVSEYWVVDARGKAIQFAIYRWQKRGYVTAISRGGWQKSRVFGFEFRLTRYEAHAGFWRYRLESR